MVGWIEKAVKWLSENMPSWDSIKNSVSNAWDSTKNSVGNAWNTTTEYVGGAWQKVKGWAGLGENVPPSRNGQVATQATVANTNPKAFFTAVNIL